MDHNGYQFVDNIIFLSIGMKHGPCLSICSFCLLFHSCVCECGCHSFGIIVPTLSVVLFSTYLYFTLEYLEVELVSLLMADYFGFCPVVVSLIEGFSTLNLVSSLLCHCVCFVVFVVFFHYNRA